MVVYTVYSHSNVWICPIVYLTHIFIHLSFSFLSMP